MTDDDPQDSGPGRRGDGAGWEATRADVVRQLRGCLADGTPAATAVVTAVEGSAYRRPGARLVVTHGSSLGAITAGCLEGPVAEAAREAIEDGTLSTETYDLTESDDESWGMGLGCNGVVDVLLDPVDASLTPALDAMARKEQAVVVTALEGDGERVEPGDRTTVLEDGSVAAADALDGTGRAPLPDPLLDAVRDELAVESIAALSESTTVSAADGGVTVTVFCDVYEPIPTLLVFGSQGDVGPVTRFARETGFRVEVVTARGARADAERFPAADTVRSVRAPELDEAVEAPEHTYAVLMSHNFLDDRLALASLLDTRVPYVGLMGPRERFEEMRDAFTEAGEELSAAELDRVSTPVGLDLGGDEPTQIAMSVVAEVLAVVNDRSGGRLSATAGPIHDR